MFEVYKNATYMGAHIVVRHVTGIVWEYVMFKDGYFYSAYITVRPQWWRMFCKNPYTEVQIQGSCQWLVNAACATAESINKQRDEAATKKKQDGKGKKEDEKMSSL